MKLEDVNVEKLLPLFMRSDPANQAAAEVASEALQAFAQGVAKLSTWDALELLSEAELDALADELRVLWYNAADTLESKRALIAHSDKVYMHLGTVKAVTDVISDIFGPAKIEQFYEIAGGQPHYFRIAVENASALSAENEAKLERVLALVNRKSQWLERVYAQTVARIPLTVGLAVSVSTTSRVLVDKFPAWQDEVNINTHVGTTSEPEKTETTTITE